MGMNSIFDRIDYAQDRLTLVKAPPGPKPKRFGPDVDWDDEKRRWVKKPKGEQSSDFPIAPDKPDKPMMVLPVKPKREDPSFDYRNAQRIDVRQLKEEGLLLRRAFKGRDAPSYASVYRNRGVEGLYDYGVW